MIKKKRILIHLVWSSRPYDLDTISRALLISTTYSHGSYAAPHRASRSHRMARIERTARGHTAYLWEKCRGQASAAVGRHMPYGSPGRPPPYCVRHTTFHQRTSAPCLRST